MVRGRIRRARPGDAALVLDFIRRLARYEKLEREVLADVSLVRRHLLGPRSVARAVIAEVEGTPVGFCVYYRTFSTFLARPGLYIEDLFVDEAWRGQGWGRRLLSHVAQEAVRRGYGRLEWSVLDWNRDAIAFYERMGARAAGDWTVFRLAGAALRSAAGFGRGASGKGRTSIPRRRH